MYDMAKMKHWKTLIKGAPAGMEAFTAFDKAAMADGAVPKKYKELIALAVALTTQCPYCLEIHRGNAVKAGATILNFFGISLPIVQFSGGIVIAAIGWSVSGT